MHPSRDDVRRQLGFRAIDYEVNSIDAFRNWGIERMITTQESAGKTSGGSQ
jgi:hypothetical protein